MARLRVSLANKCQLLFGAAVVLILLAALMVPWLRLQKLVEEGQREIARRLTDSWLKDAIQPDGRVLVPTDSMLGAKERDPSLEITYIDRETLEFGSIRDPFLAAARIEFETWPNKSDEFLAQRDDQGRWLYRYARAVRQRDLEPGRASFEPTLPATQVANPLRAMLIVEMRADWAQMQLRLNQIYLAIAGLLAGVLAIGTFWFILTRLVLSPVRVLRDTAEKVAEGDLNIRSDINTGDEFEQLSQTFNTMLATLKTSQDKLRDLNKQLDLKLGELAASNLSLYEANRIKGDFLANVSHELRTPLNSIIGFAEVLADSFPASDETAEKKRRYIDNILLSSRSLLAMITDLLDLAKIEAGRMDLHVDRMSVADTCEALLNLIRPQADRKAQVLELAVDRDVPVVQTDPGKFQQIIFNFLSNAVKFTPDGGRIELGAAPVRDSSAIVVGVRVWVRDSGPGIPVEMHDAVFEKFRQLDAGHTKQHAGTGLGLAISRELARLLEGEVRLDSDTGKGATFSLIIPLVLEEKSQPLMPDMMT